MRSRSTNNLPTNHTFRHKFTLRRLQRSWIAYSFGYKGEIWSFFRVVLEKINNIAATADFRVVLRKAQLGTTHSKLRIVCGSTQDNRLSACGYRWSTLINADHLAPIYQRVRSGSSHIRDPASPQNLPTGRLDHLSHTAAYAQSHLVPCHQSPPCTKHIYLT